MQGVRASQIGHPACLMHDYFFFHPLLKHKSRHMGWTEISLLEVCVLMQKSVALTVLPTHPRSIEFDHSHFQRVHHASQSLVFQKHLPRCHDNDYLVISLAGATACIKDFIPVETEVERYFTGQSTSAKLEMPELVAGC